MTDETRTPDDARTPARKPRKCPICSKPVPAGASAFCSERCQQVDLGRWLTGDYAIPVKPTEEEDAEV